MGKRAEQGASAAGGESDRNSHSKWYCWGSVCSYLSTTAAAKAEPTNEKRRPRRLRLRRSGCCWSVSAAAAVAVPHLALPCRLEPAVKYVLTDLAHVLLPRVFHPSAMPMCR